MEGHTLSENNWETTTKRQEEETKLNKSDERAYYKNVQCSQIVKLSTSSTSILTTINTQVNFAC